MTRKKGQEAACFSDSLLLDFLKRSSEEFQQFEYFKKWATKPQKPDHPDRLPAFNWIFRRKGRAAEDFEFVLSMMPPPEDAAGGPPAGPLVDDAPRTARDLRREAWQKAAAAPCICEERDLLWSCVPWATVKGPISSVLLITSILYNWRLGRGEGPSAVSQGIQPLIF